MAKEAYKEIDFSAERNVWDYFFGELIPQKQRAKRQAEMQRFANGLKKFFGSRDLWVKYLTLLADEWDKSRGNAGTSSESLKILDTKGYVTKRGGMHPRALRLIIEYGEVYRPGVIDNIYPRDPRSGQCFANSCALMLGYNKEHPKGDLVYVEGIVVGAASFIMPHGWNAKGIKGRETMDWTHYAATRWSYYFGIPFTEAEVREIARAAGHPNRMGAIFSSSWFTPEAEMCVRKILAKRRRD